MTTLMGTETRRVSSTLIFFHPSLSPQKLFVNSGANSIKWSYILNTQTEPTVAGEVVQILSATVGPITIQGITAGMPTEDQNISLWSPGYEEGDRSPNVELAEIQDWFRQYMFLAGSQQGGEFRNEVALRFRYPARGWDFYIAPTALEGFNFNTIQYAAPWSITAEIVSDNARSMLQLETMGQYTNDLTKRSLLAQMNVSAFDTLSDKSLQAIDPTWHLGRKNPFREPVGSLGGTSLIDELATTMGDNFHRLVSAWTHSNPEMYLNPLDTNTQLPQDVDSKYELDVRHTAGVDSGGSGIPGGSGTSGTDSSSGSAVTEVGTGVVGVGAPSNCQPTLSALQKYLQGSLMAGEAQNFLDAGIKNGIQAAFLVGLAAQETSLGVNLQLGGPHGGTYNAFNWGGRNFSSWKDGIYTVANGLATGSDYFRHDPPRYSVEDIYLGVYCGSGCSTGNILNALNALNGDASDVRCGDGASGGCSIQAGFVFYSQEDPRWANYPWGTSYKSPMGQSGCGPTSMAMVVSSFGHTMTPIEVASKFGQYHTSGGASHSLFAAVASSVGLTATAVGADFDRAVTALQNCGLVVIALDGSSQFTNNGHIMVLRAVTSTGAFFIGDPNTYPGRDNNHTAFSRSTMAQGCEGLWVIS